MDDVKDKVKGFMKKVNNPFSASSSSSGKFKGQGRVLGSSSSEPTNPATNRSYTTVDPNQNRRLPASTNPRSSPRKVNDSVKEIPKRLETTNNSDSNGKPANGFDPYGSLVTSIKRNPNGYSLNVFECPVCGQAYGSEEQVSNHIETCLSSSEANNNAADVADLNGDESGVESKSELEARVAAYVSGKPSEGSIQVLFKLLGNIVKEPENSKFRKIRLGNPKIREAVGDVVGGVELLEFIGFELREESGEMWAEMEVPSQEKIGLISNAISLLEPRKNEDSSPTTPAEIDVPVEPKKIDRQVRVFFSVPESVAAKIELPDSFYNLTLEELKRETEMRKKKMAESQLLIPKSFKEKQAKAKKRRYRRTVIRVQFPDGVVLQGVFAPWEPTTALYEFVSSSLKEPSLDFELLHPIVIRRRVIPHFGASVTLEDEDLVPSALIKFRPIETDSIVFTGLCNQLLEISEPLLPDSAVAPPSL